MKPISQQGIGASDLAKNVATAKLTPSKVEAEKSKVDTAASPVKSLATAIAQQGPPVDVDKIAAIRAAIADGNYAINPDKIADQMVEQDLVRGNDQ